MGFTPDEAAISAAMPRAEVVFGVLSRLLGQKDYLASAQLTLADLMVAPHMDFLEQTPEWSALTLSRPNLIAWLERMKERKSMQLTSWDAVTQLARAG
jgi:glutathione S-transferase